MSPDFNLDYWGSDPDSLEHGTGDAHCIILGPSPTVWDLANGHVRFLGGPPKTCRFSFPSPSTRSSPGFHPSNPPTAGGAGRRPRSLRPGPRAEVRGSRQVPADAAHQLLGGLRPAGLGAQQGAQMRHLRKASRGEAHGQILGRLRFGSFRV